jgi:anti-sigma regulatory factor (Ser/Thr protein kinase)
MAIAVTLYFSNTRCRNGQLLYSRPIAGPEFRFESSPPRPGPGRTAEIELPRSPDAGRRARAFVERHCGPDLADRVVRDAKLIVTELANNAVVHGEGRITLRAQLRDDAIRVEVIDEGSGNVPTIREEAEADGPGGRGLQIVDALSARWGTFEGTTHVWADIPLVPAAAD